MSKATKSKEKASRAPNFLPSERQVFMYLMPKYSKVLENKSTSAVSRTEKDEAWLNICVEFIIPCPLSIPVQCKI